MRSLLLSLLLGAPRLILIVKTSLETFSSGFSYAVVVVGRAVFAVVVVCVEVVVPTLVAWVEFGIQTCLFVEL